MHRQFLHPESLAQVFHNAAAEFFRVGVLPLPDGVEVIFPCVFCRKFEQGELVSLYGNRIFYVRHLHIRHSNLCHLNLPISQKSPLLLNLNHLPVSNHSLPGPL